MNSSMTNLYPITATSTAKAAVVSCAKGSLSFLSRHSWTSRVVSACSVNRPFAPSGELRKPLSGGMFGMGSRNLDLDILDTPGGGG